MCSSDLQQLGRINASAHHLLGLIDEILTFARVDIGRERVRYESLSVNHTLADASALVQPMADDKQIAFVVELLDEDQAIQTDGTKLRQMLVNLLSNGIKFTEKGEVRLGCAVNNGILEIQIADTGVGIAPENLASGAKRDEKDRRHRPRFERDAEACAPSRRRRYGREQVWRGHDFSFDDADEGSCR